MLRRQRGLLPSRLLFTADEEQCVGVYFALRCHESTFLTPALPPSTSFMPALSADHEVFALSVEHCVPQSAALVQLEGTLNA
jgi:hypothetical protein